MKINFSRDNYSNPILTIFFVIIGVIFYFSFTNKIDLENEFVKNIECGLDYSSCKIIYVKNYSVSSKYNNYYKFDYINNTENFDGERFKLSFYNNSKKMFTLDKSNIEENNYLKIVKFEINTGELAFNLNRSIKNNITNIYVEMIDDDNVYP